LTKVKENYQISGCRLHCAGLKAYLCFLQYRQNTGNHNKSSNQTAKARRGFEAFAVLLLLFSGLLRFSFKFCRWLTFC